jgi:hypothetical protein
MLQGLLGLCMLLLGNGCDRSVLMSSTMVSLNFLVKASNFEAGLLLLLRWLLLLLG